MRSYKEFGEIYLHRGYVDFRKGINGLSYIVESSMKLQAFSESLFLFTNKRRNRLKILYWDKTGFALWMKHLDKAKFKWPNRLTEDVLRLNHEEVDWLLRGLDFTKIQGHEALEYDSVI